MRARPRLLLRLFSLAVFVLPFLPLARWPVAAAALISASPFLALGAALGARSASLFTLACLPLLILAFFKQRWFCWHICPTGSILQACSSLRKCAPRPERLPYFGAWLLFMAIGLAAAGYPILIFLDPLSILGGFLGAWRGDKSAWETCAAALPLLTLAALSILFPHVWCQRLCPLGALQHLAGRLGRVALTAQGAPEGCAPGYGIDRRLFLLALAGGASGLLVAPRATSGSMPIVRPPGAAGEDVFAGLCARCGSCASACPEKIIHPDLGASGLDGLLTPALKFDRAYCNEWCRECLLACPTGAIRRLSLEQKRLTATGEARINRSACLAWANRQDCMVCQEFCPYHAIAIRRHRGVNCPEVIAELCRGCGACESQCPAFPRKAIRVAGLPAQRKIELPAAPDPGA